MPTTSTLTYQEPVATGGNREDLSDKMWDLSPTATPGITAMGKNTSTATSHDWLTDTLTDSDETTAVEGADATAARPASRVRLSNYTNIIERTAKVSRTQDRVKKGGGVKGELSYQVARRIKEMKLSAEKCIYGVSRIKAAGDEDNARVAGSFDTYITDGWAGPGDGTAPAGNSADVATKGSARNFSEDILAEALAGLWERSNGNENVIAIMGRHQRKVFSDFAKTSIDRNISTDDKKFVAAINVYDGDYHLVTATPSRQCRADAVYIQDSEYVKLSELDPLQTSDLGKVGDSRRKQVVWEWTLEVCDPRAHVVIDSLTTA